MIDTDDPDKRPALIPLSQYAPPAAPTRDTLQRLLAEMRGWWPGPQAATAPRAAPSATVAPDTAALDAVAGPPDHEPTVEALDRGLHGWPAVDGAIPQRALIVLPPGDTAGFVADWARRSGHALLEPPARDTLTSSRPPLPDLIGDGPLVIPALSSWFRRRRDGLYAIRALFERIADADRPVIAACNSWAWAYLAVAVDGAALWPEPLTPPACEAADLRAWFDRLRTRDEQRTVIVDTQSGEDMLAGGAEAPVPESLAALAARSHGIPWIAWRLWRSGLRGEGTDDAARPDPEAARRRFRFHAPSEPVLPSHRRDEALLILHALLIHGTLDTDELNGVLPFAIPGRRLHGLQAAGFLGRAGDDRWYCEPATYPVVRSALQAAGFPSADI